MLKKIKILHVLGTLDRAGAENLIMDIYKGIDRDKFEFDFVVHGNKTYYYENEINKLGGKIYKIPKYKVHNHFKYKKKFNNILKNNHYDIVHGHVRSTAKIYLKIAKKYKIKTILHSHSNGERKDKAYIVKKILMNSVVKVADFRIACSQKAGEWLFKNKEFMVLNNCIDVKKFKYDEKHREIIREKIGIKDELLIGHVGRMDNNKNQMFIIDVFYKVLKNTPNTKLLLLGDGNYRTDLIEKVEKLNIKQHVIFTGNISNVHQYYSAMDLFIFPSKVEGFGIALLEAQASGLPAVISDVIPKEAMIANNITVEKLDVEAAVWAKHILKINRSQNHSRNTAYLNIIEKGYDVTSNVRKIEEVYISITTKRVLYWGLSNNLGGIEVGLNTISKYSNQIGIKCDFLVGSEDVCFKKEIINRKSKLYVIQSNRRNIIKYNKELFQFFRHNAKDYQSIHFFLQSASSIEAVIIARLFNKNIVIDSRSAYKHKKIIGRILIGINKKILPFITRKRLALSHEAGISMFGNSDFEIIPAPIELESFTLRDDKDKNDIKVELGIDSNELILGHIGRFVEEKNHCFLIETFKEILKLSNNNAKLILVGDGPLKVKIENLIKENDLSDKVLLTGIRSDVPKLFKLMDLAVFPSKFEGLGRVVIESQLSNVKTVISTGIPDSAILDPRLIKKISLEKSTKQWAETIYEFYLSKPKQNIQMSTEKYDIVNIIKKLEEIYFR